MKKLEIQEHDGFLDLEDLPHNCIFNKVVTGCGGTTIALKNGENYVIAVPTTELIENKCYPPNVLRFLASSAHIILQSSFVR